jgi:murein DD-endopeptidase MepM/ murein hydrolase activator NlpD
MNGDPKPARCRLEVQELESRIQPANLKVTNAYLCNLDGDKITTAAVGSIVYVKAEFTAQDLPASASHVLRYTLDGAARTSAPLSWGAGISGTSSWVGILGNWVVKPGTHSVTVKLDATNTVSETNGVDNIKSFSFTPVTFQSAYVPGQKFITPLAGTPQVHWKVGDYVDLDTDENQKLVYYGRTGNAARTYDGHNGVDISAVGFSTQYVGLPILAAADGVVTQTADGNFDEYTQWMGDNAEGGYWGNFVTIKHGNGWETNYIHLRKGSVAVSEGDFVKAGDILGMMASSGNSSGTHLHFRVAHNGLLVEPFVSPTGYWVNPLPYAGNLPYSNPPLSTYNLIHTTENVGMAKIPINRKTLFGTETVNWGTQSSTALAGSDYTASSGTITFGSLEFTKYIFVPITNDSLHESTEKFRINLTNDDGDSWSRDVRIVDNDAILNYNDDTDTLTVTGHTNQLNDVITLDVVGSKIKVQVNSETKYFPLNGPAGPVTKVVVNAGDGNDKINVLATPAGVKTTLNGGANTDTFNIGEPGELFDAMFSLDRIKGEVTVNGGTGQNTMNLKDNSITGLARAYTVTDSYVSRSNVKYNYALVQALNVTASSGSDQFFVQSTANNTPVALEGGGGTDTVTGPNATDSWVITGTNKGTLDFSGAYFTNVERLVGGSGADTFSFAAGSPVGQVTGGGGSDTILGPNHGTTWAITAMNGGTASWSPSRFFSLLRTFGFSSVENLTGGTGTDTFKLHDGKGVSGALNGGGGTSDTLNYQLYLGPVSVDLAAGTATAIAGGLANIENATGGAADDHLIGSASGNVLRGGGGNDILLGGGGIDFLWGLDGRDILLGGLAADKLNGGMGDDILIDGTTDFDADAVKLASMRTAWAQNQPYAQRIQALNGSLTAATVHHDGVADTLTGDLDRDWFWADGIDVHDAVPNGNDKEQVN